MWRILHKKNQYVNRPQRRTTMRMGGHEREQEEKQDNESAQEGEKDHEREQEQEEEHEEDEKDDGDAPPPVHRLEGPRDQELAARSPIKPVSAL